MNLPLFVALLLVSSSTAWSAGDNLVANGDMEQDGGWVGRAVDSAVVPQVQRITSDRFQGVSCLRVSIDKGKLGGYPVLCSPPFATEQGKTYRISYALNVPLGGVYTQLTDGGNDWRYYTIPGESVFPRHWKRYSTLYTEARPSRADVVLYFGAQGAKTEFLIDDVSVVEVDLSRENVVRQWRKLFPNGDYAIWQKSSAWDNTLKPIALPPDGAKECKSIRLAMGRSEYESASFVLTNLSDRQLEFEVSARSPRQIPVTIREAEWMTAYSGNRINDALPLLDHKLAIPPGESREVWLTVQTQNAKPGSYKANVNIKAQGRVMKSVPVNVIVYPVTLPKDMPLYTLYWDYIVMQDPKLPMEQYKALTDDMKRHYVNTVVAHASICPQLRADQAGKWDFSELDRALEVYKMLQPKMIVFNCHYIINWPIEPPEFLCDDWKKLAKEWARAWAAHMKEKGYGYDRWALYPLDENLGPKLYEVVKTIKEADPKIRVFINYPGEKAEQVRRFAPYTDVYCPQLPVHLQWPGFEEYGEGVRLAKQLLRKSDKFFWTYANHYGWQPEEASPYNYYRLAVWRAWNEGMGGFGFWNYGYSSSWKNYPKKAGEPTYAVIYRLDDPNCPLDISRAEIIITGKRWEATREGVEDYGYLCMLRQAVASPPKGVAAKTLVQARQLLRELPQRTLADPYDPTRADTAKEQILSMLAKLRP